MVFEETVLGDKRMIIGSGFTFFLSTNALIIKKIDIAELDVVFEKYEVKELSFSGMAYMRDYKGSEYFLVSILYFLSLIFFRIE